MVKQFRHKDQSCRAKALDLWDKSTDISLANYFERIVSDYKLCHQERAKKELHWFAIQPNIQKVIELAALAKSPGGKRLSHQRRIPERVLEESCRRLLSNQALLENCSSFEELHEVIAQTLESIHGIGELTVYDTSLRIGSFLKLEPSKVFLHAGTRIGARYLGMGVSKSKLEISEFPVQFRMLKPREIEDVLCIYKKWFSRIDD